LNNEVDMIIFVLLGLLIGSFLNVVIYRVPEGESIVFPSSHCPMCENTLSPSQNIPILSYILLKGKCHYCKTHISLQYPIIELITGVIFGYLYTRTGLSIQLAFDTLLAMLFICVVMIDLKHEIIPDSINLLIGIGGIAMLIIVGHTNLSDALYGSLAGGGILFLIALAGPMGGGDIKFMAATGLWLGLFPTIFSLLISFICGGFVGLLLILFKVKDRKDHIPFGPFLVVGCVVSYYFYYDAVILFLKITS